MELVSNDTILKEINNNGIFVSENLLKNNEIERLCHEFSFDEDVKIIDISNLNELKQFSETLYNFVQNKNISKFLEDYLGDVPVCTTIHFTRCKQTELKSEKNEINDGSVMAFHNDDKGKQIKINFLLKDLEKNSNGLGYAMKSHRINWLEKLILYFLKKLNYMKKWDKHLFNYYKNKYKNRKVNYMFSEEVLNKFNIKHVYGKKGLVYIFDTNGFHRQGHSAQVSSSPREVLTLYFLGKKKL